MKRVLLTLVCLVAMTAANTSLKAQQVTIPLMPGWTWFSYPSTDTVDFTTALGSFTPAVGDIIESQFHYTEYVDGGWYGDSQQFYPGYGYLYYSSRNMPVFLTFNVQQPTPQIVVTTLEPTDITTNSATCGGNVTSSNGDYVSVILRGVCWSTNPNPTFNDHYIEAGNGLGSFTISMTELTFGTSYYVRAFAVTPTGTFYGEELNFTALESGGNDHDYVDLGLPSGTLWATCNVGANAPEEYGDYFAWGETVPKETYAWSTYKYCNGEYNTITKYSNNAEYGNNGFTDTLTILEACDDAATANWGVGWRMPTWEEMNELYDICTHEWTTQNGVNGGLFTGPNGNSIFLPAAGRDGDSDFAFVGSAGFYWNSKLGWLYPLYACYFAVGSSGDFGYASQERFYGFSVRPVCQSQN